MNITNLRHAVLIWLFTNLFGAISLWFIINQEIPFYVLILLSTILSLPAILLLMPALYILDFIDGAWKRIVFSITASLGICATILMILISIIGDYDGMAAEVGRMAFPFVVAAPICFIVIVEISIAKQMKS